MLVSAGTRKELADVACPVLALAGKYDPYWTPEETVTKIVRHVKFEVIEAGHFMSIQNPDRVAAAIRPFLLDGAAAEYCLTTPDEIAPKPEAIDHVQAVVVPISGLTAWQAFRAWKTNNPPEGTDPRCAAGLGASLFR
jgi:NADPH:quinone reductase-like Zn-dependent oxidoreductase